MINDKSMLFYYLQYEGERRNIARKLLVSEHAVGLDYDDAGANTKHDPPKKKPPVGGAKP